MKGEGEQSKAKQSYRATELPKDQKDPIREEREERDEEVGRASSRAGVEVGIDNPTPKLQSCLPPSGERGKGRERTSCQAQSYVWPRKSYRATSSVYHQKATALVFEPTQSQDPCSYQRFTRFPIRVDKSPGSLTQLNQLVEQVQKSV